MSASKRLITISMDNKKLRRDLAELTGRGLQRNVTNVVNRLAFDGQSALVKEMKRVFKNPTKWTLNSFKVIKAKPGRSEASIATRDMKPGYNKGTASARYLSPDVFGDERGMKPSEHALAKISGNQYWAPGRDAPLDGNGNIKPSVITNILADLGALETKNHSPRGKRFTPQETGRYFVARHAETGRPIGIYQRTGNGRDFLEILKFFYTPPHYRKILPAQKVVDAVVEKNARRYVEEEIAIRLRRKLEGKS